jgi:hypothetical protein
MVKIDCPLIYRVFLKESSEESSSLQGRALSISVIFQAP